ncbi:hypothetical protein RAH41_08250 [Gottfriedia acidiceleris]|uniref:hypothetical protein n=1 Tax=Gottfriedia acidiceleris TaxID=371036 RepID=UPI002F2692A2
MGALIFLLVLVIIAVGLIYLVISSQNKFKQKIKQSGAENIITGLHIEGLGIGLKELCEIYVFKDHIRIETFNKVKFNIKMDQIRAAVVKNEQELVAKNKSVVGRAVIGTLLVPGLGTIVGGMSGIGTKTKKGKTNTYLILNFLNSKGELDAVTFQNNYNLIAINKVCKTINDSLVKVNGEKVIEL